MFVSTLRLSANRSVSRRACGSHHSAPFHTLTLTTLAEKGAVARSPFDVQFISASTTEPVRRSSVGLRVASVSRALIVLRALASSPLLVIAAIRELFSAVLTLPHTPASVRGLCIFAPSTCAIDRLQSAACKLVGSVPVTLGPILFISRHRSEPVFRAKKCAKLHFFPSPFNDLSMAQTGDPFSGLSCGGIALQYTDE